MAREIKFRAKNTKNEWVYGEYAELATQGDCLAPSIIDTGFVHVVNPETLDQYTGLTDKNGKEIYEGDIVRFTFADDEIYNYISEVKPKGVVDTPKYHENDMTLLEWLDGYDEVEVIGNIYENPELI